MPRHKSLSDLWSVEIENGSHRGVFSPHLQSHDGLWSKKTAANAPLMRIGGRRCLRSIGYILSDSLRVDLHRL